MNKKDFFAMLNKALSSFPLEQKLELVDEKMPVWLEDYGTKLVKEKDYCYECHRYSKIKDFTYVEEEVIRRDHYHDDELLAKKKILFKICPKCGQKSEEAVLSVDVIKWL